MNLIDFSAVKFAQHQPGVIPQRLTRVEDMVECAVKGMVGLIIPAEPTLSLPLIAEPHCGTALQGTLILGSLPTGPNRANGHDSIRTRLFLVPSFAWAQRLNVCLNSLSRVSDGESEGAGVREAARGGWVVVVRGMETRITQTPQLLGRDFRWRLDDASNLL